MSEKCLYHTSHIANQLFLSELRTLRGLNNNMEGGGLIIRDRLKARWGVLEDKNELACSWHQGLHVGPDLSGYLAERGLLAISKTISKDISVNSVVSSEWSERARDKTSANVCG